MSFTHLLALVMLLAFGGGVASAQTSQNDAPNVVAFWGAASANSVDNSGQHQFVISPDPRITPSQSSVVVNPLDRIDVDEYRPAHSHSFDLLPGPDSGKTCFYIRNYLVIRDSPHSDSTHRDGSSTCVPAARFRVYTTDRGR
ncbi:MAG: hypothetical protein WBQ85_10695 [Candidatus Sulfotelmatobacter sp.]